MIYFIGNGPSHEIITKIILLLISSILLGFGFKHITLEKIEDGRAV